MDKTQRIMRQKKRRFALVTAVTALLALAVAVFAVLLAYELPWRYDMTAQRLFTLTPRTQAVLDGLGADVTIGAVYAAGGEEMMVQSLLAEYEKASGRVTVEYIDAEREPARLARYQLPVAAIPNGTLIVQSGGRYKLIQNSSLFSSTLEGNTFQGEREITGAIRYVTAGDMPVLYLLQGHREASPDTQLSQAVSGLQLDAYQVLGLNLTQSGGVPDDAGAVLMMSPKEDITPQELQLLLDYQKKGGAFFLTVDAVLNSNAVRLPNLNALCNTYGVDIANNYVVEEDPDRYLSSNRLWLIPFLNSHEITAPINDAKKMVILPVVRGLGLLEVDKDEVSVTPLMASSEKSWIRNDMTVTSDTPTQADLTGPIALGYAAARSNVRWGSPASRAVILGNGSFCYDGNLEVQANGDLFTNSVGWLVGSGQSEAIAAKVINADQLIVNSTDFIKLSVICVAVLPLIAFFGALGVWVLRRNQ